MLLLLKFTLLVPRLPSTLRQHSQHLPLLQLVPLRRWQAPRSPGRRGTSVNTPTPLYFVSLKISYVMPVLAIQNQSLEPLFFF